MLIVISGPIASGKSSVARALAREFELRGRSAAAIDLDLLYEMLEHDGARKDDDGKWQLARRAAAALSNAWLKDGADVVIVEGDFLTATKRHVLIEELEPTVVPRFVTLRVSFDEAVARVESDPTRTFSRDLVFLRQHHEAAESALRSLPGSDLIQDTESVEADEVARAVAAWAHEPSDG